MKVKNQSVQWLRVFACLSVLLVHMGQQLGAEGKMASITGVGAYGPQLFFVISGYLAFKSVDLFYGNYFGYLKKRIIRIIPMYYGVILLWYILRVLIYKDMPKDSTGLGWWRYIFFISTSVPDDGVYEWYNIGATWSISFFVIFYLICPFLYKCTNSFNKAVLLEILLLVIEHFAAVYAPTGYRSPFTGLYVFGIGILWYFAEKEETWREYLLVLSVIALYFLIMFGGETHSYVCIWGVLLCCLTGIQTPYFRLLDILDEYSYAIYLTHMIVIYIAGTVYADVFKQSLLLYAVSILFGTLILTVLLHWGIEKPFSKMA